MKQIIGSLVLALASVLMVGANAQKAPALLDINTATEAQINGLPSVSNKIANAIFKNRPYANLDDLNNKVKLSKKTLDKIRSLVSFNGVPAGVSAATPANNTATVAAGTTVVGTAAATTTNNTATNTNTSTRTSKASANTATTANPVNVNTASREELMTIPEVGPKNSIKLAPFMRF